MKSAYELAMERLQKENPQEALTDDQKAEIAAIDERFRAKIAEREVFLGDLIVKATTEGNFAELAELETQKVREIASLKEECDREKEKVRGQ